MKVLVTKRWVVEAKSLKLAERKVKKTSPSQVHMTSLEHIAHPKMREFLLKSNDADLKDLLFQERNGPLTLIEVRDTEKDSFIVLTEEAYKATSDSVLDYAKQMGVIVTTRNLLTKELLG